MPEVIEVRQYADFITKNTRNSKLLDIKIIEGRYKKHGPFKSYNLIKKNLPIKILDVQTKGKYTYMSFEKDFYIGVTLGLFGGWFFKKNNSNKFIHGLNSEMYEQQLRNKYIERALKQFRVEFIFESGSLIFYDQLSFGTISIFTSKIDIQKKINTIGIDIMHTDSTFELFKKNIEKSTNLEKPIGNVLMNQKVISGVGNYLRADSLWLSKISPFRKVKDINNKELYTLYYNIRLLTWGSYNFDKAVKLKIIDKKDKMPKDYNRHFFIYTYEKDIYNNIITKEKLYEGSQIRYIYWVKNYQK